MLQMLHDAQEVSLADWERRKEFVGFADADAGFLREFHPFAELYADEVIDELYRHLFRFEETRAFFPDDHTLNRVKGLQREYFLGLTRGDYGEAYLANRLHLGRTHQRIGLSPRWYMGAYSIYMQLIFPRIMPAFASDAERARRVCLALFKIISLDQEVAITTYVAAANEVISRQAREIVEVSTPVVQVWDGVLVAPIIGTLESMRTEQFVERLLERVVETNSPVVLLDITGVPAVDTRTAQHLIEAITAVRLLGAQIVLTGVRPAIAQTIAHLGIDLGDIVTRSALGHGLRDAFDILGLEVTRKHQN